MRRVQLRNSRHLSIGSDKVPTVVFLEPDGTERGVDGNIGDSVMVAATLGGVDGINGECGGNSMCATCHVFVDPGQIEQLAPMGIDEDALLDGTAVPRRPNSRLSCQIILSRELDGLIVTIPEQQI